MARAPLMRSRVALGAAWLNVTQPGWIWAVDLDRLDLKSPCRCVLGQLSPELPNTGGLWDRILAKFGLLSALTEDDPKPGQLTAWMLGFTTVQLRGYPYLTREWKWIILQLRGES